MRKNIMFHVKHNIFYKKVFHMKHFCVIIDAYQKERKKNAWAE